MTVSLTPLYNFLANENNRNLFKRLAEKIPGANPGESMNLVLLFAYLNDFVECFKHDTVERVEEFMLGTWYGSAPKAVAVLADIQELLIELFRTDELYTRVKQVCPALTELEKLPPLGWLAYDELYNAQADRCFGERYIPGQGFSYGREDSRIHIQENAFDAIFIKHMDDSLYTYYYAERIALTRPKQPRDFGDELRIVDELGTAALVVFEKCSKRSDRFYTKASDEFRIDYPKEYKKAVARKK